MPEPSTSLECENVEDREGAAREAVLPEVTADSTSALRAEATAIAVEPLRWGAWEHRGGDRLGAPRFRQGALMPTAFPKRPEIAVAAQRLS